MGKPEYLPDVPGCALDEHFLMSMRIICRTIAEAGYDPYAQLLGYLSTGDDAYITGKGNARSLITSLDKDKLHAYINKYL